MNSYAGIKLGGIHKERPSPLKPPQREKVRLRVKSSFRLRTYSHRGILEMRSNVQLRLADHEVLTDSRSTWISISTDLNVTGTATNRAFPLATIRQSPKSDKV